MQGQEKLTFVVILLFFTITLCCTLMSANEKIYDSLIDEQISLNETHTLDNLFPVHFLKYVFYAVSNSVHTILTMPFVLRRLTLAECCSWFVN